MEHMTGLPQGLPMPLPPTQLPTLRPPQPLSLMETSQGSSLVSWAKVRAPLCEVGCCGGRERRALDPCQVPPLCPPVCTQLLVSRPDEENITSYLQLLEKCLSHEVGLSWGVLGGGHRTLHCIPAASWAPPAPTGVHGDAEEEALVLEAAGPEAAPRLPQEGAT